jgi:hypothetical protein
MTSTSTRRTAAAAAVMVVVLVLLPVRIVAIARALLPLLPLLPLLLPLRAATRPGIGFEAPWGTTGAGSHHGIRPHLLAAAAAAAVAGSRVMDPPWMPSLGYAAS